MADPSPGRRGPFSSLVLYLKEISPRTTTERRFSGLVMVNVKGNATLPKKTMHLTMCSVHTNHITHRWILYKCLFCLVLAKNANYCLQCTWMFLDNKCNSGFRELSVFANGLLVRLYHIDKLTYRLCMGETMYLEGGYVLLILLRSNSLRGKI